MTPEDALKLALHWADRGLPVFPVALCWDETKAKAHKRPLTTQGHRDATADRTEAAALFLTPPLQLRAGEVMGVGIWPGPGGWFVIDLDVAGGATGPQNWADLCARNGFDDRAVTRVPTPSCGAHLWWPKPPGVMVGNGHDLPPGIDVRGDTGWVVAPGVETPWGSYGPPASVPELARVEVPGWLAELLKPPGGAPTREAVDVAPQRADWADWSGWARRQYEAGIAALQQPPGGRHQAVGEVVGSLARAEEQRAPGATSAIDALGDHFATVITSPGRNGAAEYASMVDWSRGQAAGTPSTVERAQRERMEILDSVPWWPGCEPPGLGAQPEAEAKLDDQGRLERPWEPEDLAPYLVPGWEPEPPTVLLRTDGRALWYRGEVNWLHGQSGSCKTWVALVAVVQEVQAGRHVLWIHYEDPNASKLVERLLLLGLTGEQILTHVHASVVGGHRLTKGIPSLRTLTKRYGGDPLVVLDTVGEAIGADGIAVKEDEKLVAWIHATVRVLAADGCPVLVLDHLPMAEPGRLDPVGSYRKRAAVTGSMFLAEAAPEVTRNQDGKVKLTCAKDRSGHWERGSLAAEVHLIHTAGGAIDARVMAPRQEAEAGPGGEVEPDHVRLARVVHRALVTYWPKRTKVEHKLGGVSMNRLGDGILSNVKARNTLKAKAIETAIANGWIEETPGPRNARLLSPGNEPSEPGRLLSNWLGLDPE